MGDETGLFECALDFVFSCRPGCIWADARYCRDVYSGERMGEGEYRCPGVFCLFRTFKKEWRASQILGLIVVTAALFLFADMRIAAQMDQPVLVNVFVSISLIFAFVVLYVFPVFSHFDVKIREVLSISFFIAFSRPAVTLLMAAGAVGVLCLVLFHVTFLLFFSGSLLSLILTKLSFKAFRSMDQRQEKEKAA